MKAAELLNQLNEKDFSSGSVYAKLTLYYGNNSSYLAQQKARIYNLLENFSKTYKSTDIFLVHAPGRTNLIGEHTDYNGYPVMPMAINRDILVCAAKSDDGKISISNTNPTFAARSFTVEENIQPYKAGDWGNYVKAAIAGLLPYVPGKKKQVNGFTAVYSGTIPPAGGLSSSSAMVVASALTFLHANNVEIPKVELAEILARAERFVGTEGGGMDQAISLMGKKNKALKIDFFPLHATPISMPEDYAIVICNSLVRAPKTEAAMNEYNRRPVECRLAAALIAKNLEKFSGKNFETQRLADVDRKITNVATTVFEEAVGKALNPAIQFLEQVREKLSLSQQDLNERYLFLKSGKLFSPPQDGFKVASRYDHVISEANRVESAAEALENGNVEQFAELMNASHESCRSQYEISTPELDKLVEIARSHGAKGARLTGAGFGGSTVNLVPKNDVDTFTKGVVKDYYHDYLPQVRPDIQFAPEELENIVFASSAVEGAELMLE